MQYFLRFHLSCAVVMSHLWANAFGSSGSYAVSGFYVISGYVITKVLQERYLKLDSGIKKFWINRLLRLYPTFLVVTIFGYLVARHFPAEANALGANLAIPENSFGQELIEKAGFPGSWWPLFYVPNLIMLGNQAPLFWMPPIAFAPTSWSTNVELYYYAILSLGAASSSNSARSFMKIAAALLATLPLLYGLQHFGFFHYGEWAPGITINAFLLFYKTFLGWSFFFALGCFIYFQPKLTLSRAQQVAVLAICLMFPFIYVKNVHALILLRVLFGLWVALTILSFSDDRGSEQIRFLGDISYPLFLIHWPAAAVVSWVTSMPKNGPLFLIYSLTLSIALSAIIVILVERPIEKLRRRYRR